MVGAFLPGAADTWINGYARDPFQFADHGRCRRLVYFLGLGWPRG